VLKPHSLSGSALNGGVWSTSVSDRFIARKRAPGTTSTGGWGALVPI